jgi:hypothetical protein
VVDVTLVCRALRIAQVGGESKAVEFSIDLLDLAPGVDVELVDALDGIGVVSSTGGSNPSPGDGLAAVLDVEGLGEERWLTARAGDERVWASECGRANLNNT